MAVAAGVSPPPLGAVERGVAVGTMVFEVTSATSPPAFAAWAGNVAALCDAVERLQPLAATLGTGDPQLGGWHGALFGKLRPQVAREPLLVAAVCGGTNTGKSLITNTLVGAVISRSVPEAARTLHPVASFARGVAERIDLAALFPGFRPVPWRSEEDALDQASADVLVWREDPGGTQPARLVVLDTPDIDGTLRENWHRAELVRNAADVIVAVLTQQKYNDATAGADRRLACHVRRRDGSHGAGGVCRSARLRRRRGRPHRSPSGAGAHPRPRRTGPRRTACHRRL